MTYFQESTRDALDYFHCDCLPFLNAIKSRNGDVELIVEIRAIIDGAQNY